MSLPTAGINRRSFLSTMGVAMLASPLAETQPAAVMYRIGFLSYWGCPIRADVMSAPSLPLRADQVIE